MKRLFKFLVAAATSFSLLIANVPLTSIVVRADGDEPSAKQYTIKYSTSCTDGNLKLLNGEVEVAADSYIYPGSTVSFSAADLPAEYTAEYVVTWDQSSETPDTVVLTSTSYTISSSLTGYSSDQTINPSELNLWRVISRQYENLQMRLDIPRRLTLLRRAIYALLMNI